MKVKFAVTTCLALVFVASTMNCFAQNGTWKFPEAQPVK